MEDSEDKKSPKATCKSVLIIRKIHIERTKHRDTRVTSNAVANDRGLFRSLTDICNEAFCKYSSWIKAKKIG